MPYSKYLVRNRNYYLMVDNKISIILTLLVYNTYAASGPIGRQIFCSAFCAPTNCQGYTPTDCNNNCNTGIGWTVSGTSCSVTGLGYQFLDSSDDSGGMIAPSPYIFSSNCSNLTGYLGGTAPYGDYTANQQVNVTLAGGTSIPHYGISFIFDIILVDIDSSTSNQVWTNTAKMTATLYNPNSTQSLSINLNTASSSTYYKNYCGNTGKN
jgi:hypothetical protein